MWVFKLTVVGMTRGTESLTGSQLTRISTQGRPYLHPAPLGIPKSSEDTLQSGPLLWLWGTSQGYPSPPRGSCGVGVFLGLLP